MPYQIKDAQPSHLDSLEQLENSCFSLPWTRAQIESQFPDEMHEFLVAEAPTGNVIGYAGMLLVLDEGYISNVAVHPMHRRQGIGGQLVEAILERARRQSLAFVTLEVRESNVAAQKLYEKYGFITVGRRKNYYELPREGAVLMTCYLKRGENNENSCV